MYASVSLVLRILRDECHLDVCITQILMEVCLNFCYLLETWLQYFSGRLSLLAWCNQLSVIDNDDIDIILGTSLVCLILFADSEQEIQGIVEVGG